MYEKITLNLTDSDPTTIPLPSWVNTDCPEGFRWSMLLEPATNGVELGEGTDRYTVQPATETIVATPYPCNYTNRPLVAQLAGGGSESVVFVFRSEN